LDLISEWCNKWGFVINSEKTVAIIFSKGVIKNEPFKLKIGGKDIRFQNSVKLLGVYFDSHLTWKNHIDFLIEKSIKGLNLMRCISGTSWGSNKDTLLTIYKSIILSSLDYCCFTFENACLTNLKRLDTIQYKSLLLATGAMRGTSLNALLGECTELPLYYRRIKITMNYLLKIYLNQQNSAKNVLQDKKNFPIGA